MRIISEPEQVLLAPDGLYTNACEGGIMSEHDNHVATADQAQPFSTRMRAIEGERYARLVVLTEVDRRKNHRYMLCRCDCGIEKIIALTGLRSGAVQSCGCLKKQRAIETHTKHGNGRSGRQSHAYRSWHNMKQRCTSLGHPNYECYGGRGITVCERWSNFMAFLEDIGEPPSHEHTLDRYPNNNGNYEPGNVRWATMGEQALNKRTNRLVTFDGRTNPLTVWARILNLPVSRLRSRLDRGWPIAQAFTVPAQQRAKRQSDRVTL